ncbi:MAG: MBL fold metallo-hydrolase [Spirochaetia bacterium]|nr:MBL fold metallo-hydrolase [Spirochaetia bacterium]
MHEAYMKEKVGMKGITRAHIEIPLGKEAALPRKGTHFIWLGQAGFLLVVDHHLILIDPYLSNYLEDNHGDLPYSHERMIPSPILPSLLSEIDYVVITHAHEDHLDPLLVRTMSEINSKVKYIIPPGSLSTMRSLGFPLSSIEIITHDKPLELVPSISIEAFPAAHPDADMNPETVWALSYRFIMKDTVLLFAGDTTIYREWVEWVHAKKNDLLVLPINGRDAEKEKNGIVGNMNFCEALLLAYGTREPLLGTHFGMFAFNTIDEQEIRSKIELFKLGDRVEITELATIYTV